MAKLSDLSLEKINQVLRRCLVECGMLQGPRSSTLQPIFLDADVRMAIVGKGDDQALAAFGDLGAI
jgi:hypothetical protein